MSSDLHNTFDKDPKGAPVGPKPVNRPRQPMVVQLDKRSMNKLKNAMVLAVTFGVIIGGVVTMMILATIAFVFGGGASSL